MASFPESVNENEIAQARLIADLWAPVAPFEQKSGRETWTVAFAPDGSYFAWSPGHRVVKLVPWSRSENKLCNDEHYNTVNKNLRKQNGDDQKKQPEEHTIDCGDIVWALAFGSSVPEKQSRCVNIEWHRFKFGQDQLLLATGLSNGRIKIWDVYTGKFLLNLLDHNEVVRDLTFAPDGSLILISASRDKTLRVWDLKDDGNMVTVLRGHHNWVYCCAFSPDSTILCSVGAGKAISRSMYHSWQRVGRRPAPWPLTMLPEGVCEQPRITFFGFFFTLFLLYREGLDFCLVLPPQTAREVTGKGQMTILKESKVVTGSLFLSGIRKRPGSRPPISPLPTGGVFLWNIENYTMIRKLEGHLNDVVSCEFSPDGALLATASHDTRVIVWDPHRGSILLELGHLFPPPTPIFAGGANDRWVRSVAFCHDGLHIASIADDKMVRFWGIDGDCPAEVAPLNNGLCCAFSPDGSVLAAGTQDGSVHFWATPRHVPSLQHLCRMALRRVMVTSSVESLPIPPKIVDYLTYRTI